MVTNYLVEKSGRQNVAQAVILFYLFIYIASGETCKDELF